MAVESKGVELKTPLKLYASHGQHRACLTLTYLEKMAVSICSRRYLCETGSGRFWASIPALSSILVVVDFIQQFFWGSIELCLCNLDRPLVAEQVGG